MLNRVLYTYYPADYGFIPQTLDDDGDPLEFGIRDKPDGANFTPGQSGTAMFQWTPLASDAGEDGRAGRGE